MHPAHSKPILSAWQVCKICLGAFGIQFGFALPQANATRIFQNLGASLDSVPLLWLAGPITGLLVQPLVGYYSDRTWTRFGRRRPYFLAGAALAAMTLIAMPNAMTLWMAALSLWILDALAQSHHGAVSRFRGRPDVGRATLQRLSHVHVLRECRRRGRQPAAVGDGVDWRVIDRPFGGSQRFGQVRVLRRRNLAHFRSVLVRVHQSRVCARGARQVRWLRHREFDGQVARQDAAPRVGLARSGNRGPRGRVSRPRARRALRARVLLSLIWRVPADGEPPAQRERVHDHSRRTRLDVGVDAPARARAVLLLVHAVHDLYLHNARRRQAALRIQ